jgi:hypothetical protein
VLQRVLRGSAATLRSTKHDGDGEPVAPTVGNTVTVQVTRSDGTDVLPAGTAATVVGDEVTVALTAAHTAELDQLTATWTERDAAGNVVATWQSAHEIVGGFFFSIAEARKSDPTLQDQTKYPATDILDTRAEVEDECESICERSFVPRFAKVTLTVAGSLLVLPHVELRRIRSVSVDGTAYTAEQVGALQFDSAGIVHLSARRGARVTITYEHGWDAPTPRLKKVTFIRLRHLLNAKLSGIPDRATSFSVTEGGTYSLAQAGRKRTGIPDVDAVYERHSVGSVTVA